MRWIFLPIILTIWPAKSEDFNEIFEKSVASVVYLEVRDENKSVVNRGTGFFVSPDGHIITAAHLSVLPSHEMVATVGQRYGTAFPLQRREADEQNDVALWQVPQSRHCQVAVTLGSRRLERLQQMLVAGFPRSEGLTASRIGISNTTSPNGYYKADGYLEPGNSGGPVFNEQGEVVAIVHGGTEPGTESNDLIPIASAIALLEKNGVQASIDQVPIYPNRCYASCRDISHGIESWMREEAWGPVDSGWLPGGHNRPGECAKLVAAALVGQPGAIIELLPGNDGMWESSKRDLFGHTEYKYYCKGTLRAGPVYAEKRTVACRLDR
jgi:hypothetical protein